MSVYVLGAGGIGSLVASSLTKSFNVNFIVRNSAKIAYLQQHQNCFHIKQLFNNNHINNFKIHDVCTAENIPEEIINFLILSVKTFDSVKSLAPLLSKIDGTTKILLVQNGMGVVDKLYEELWPNIENRPTIYQGVISHGIYQTKSERNSYNYVHAGFGDFKICKIPKDLQNCNNIKDDGIVDDKVIQGLLEGGLNAHYYTYVDLLAYQIQKLMVNACMNTVTSIIDCMNGDLAKIKANRELFTSIIKEALNVLKTQYPILKNSVLAKEILTVEELLKYVEYCGFVVNGKNSTSMRQDVINLRDVEVAYINGYVVKKAEEHGLIAPINKTIELLVETRLAVNRQKK